MTKSKLWLPVLCCLTSGVAWAQAEEEAKHSVRYHFNIESLAVFSFVLLILAIQQYFGMLKRREHASLLRLMIERGQPIPPELLVPEDGRRQPRSVRFGLVLIAVGLSLAICLWVTTHSEVWIWGLMPLSIGVASLVARKFEKRPLG